MRPPDDLPSCTLEDQDEQGPTTTDSTWRWGMTEPIRVLIADDERLVRAGFRALIDAEPGMIVVGEAADGAAAVDLARQSRPDVVLMDIRMPGVDGLDATRQIAEDPDLAHVRVLILTTFDHDEYVIEALGAGASGFVIKNTDPGQLLHGIRVVVGGEALLSPGLTRRLVARLVDRGPNRQVNAGALAQLTEREREVAGLAAYLGRRATIRAPSQPNDSSSTRPNSNSPVVPPRSAYWGRPRLSTNATPSSSADRPNSDQPSRAAVRLLTS